LYLIHVCFVSCRYTLTPPALPCQPLNFVAGSATHQLYVILAAIFCHCGNYQHCPPLQKRAENSIMSLIMVPRPVWVSAGESALNRPSSVKSIIEPAGTTSLFCCRDFRFSGKFIVGSCSLESAARESCNPKGEF
jgi:hypothetical protein